MGETAGEFLASVIARPWRPRSLRQLRPESLPWRVRLAVIVPILLLHLAAGLTLVRLMSQRALPADETLTIVSFIDKPPPRPEAVAVPTPKPKPLPPPRDDSPAGRQELPRAVKPSKVPLPGPDRREARPIDFYSPEGRLRVPEDMLDQIDRRVGDKRVFSYQVPRMDDARKLLHRNPPITFQSTRFDQYWKPDQDMLTDLLTQLVEKTTKEIRLPVPGNPGSTMICQVSLLALGGGCGVLTNGADYVGPVDDPDTLDAEEDRQCQAWWEQIVGARTQEIWRRTRDLYEAQCRKPRLRKR